MKDIAVLFVDDERNVLNALERNLIREPYRRLFAAGAREALAQMEREPVHVIVTDMRMPEMDGLTFLGKVKASYPDTVRIVLSGHTEIAQVLAAVNTGDIYRYVTKPIDDPAEFQTVIRQAIEHFALRRDRQNLIVQLTERNQELAESLASVRQLEGLLPICAKCKKIRDDKGYWQRIENYIAAHSRAVFTHGICPECAHVLFPELDVENEPEAAP
jgi:DNA-binding NtrC family response regulator